MLLMSQTKETSKAFFEFCRAIVLTVPKAASNVAQNPLTGTAGGIVLVHKAMVISGVGMAGLIQLFKMSKKSK
jgi:hypothetical protein